MTTYFSPFSKFVHISYFLFAFRTTIMRLQAILVCFLMFFFFFFFTYLIRVAEIFEQRQWICDFFVGLLFLLFVFVRFFHNEREIIFVYDWKYFIRHRCEKRYVWCICISVEAFDSPAWNVLVHCVVLINASQNQSVFRCLINEKFARIAEDAIHLCLYGNAKCSKELTILRSRRCYCNCTCNRNCAVSGLERGFRFIKCLIYIIWN